MTVPQSCRQAYSLIKKEAPAQVFSSELKNIFLIEHQRMVASEEFLQFELSWEYYHNVVVEFCNGL